MCALARLVQEEAAPRDTAGAPHGEVGMTQDGQGTSGAGQPPAAAAGTGTGPVGGDRAGRIRACLSGLAPVLLELQDDSARHAGHAGVREHAPAGGETHFTLLVVSLAFEGMGRVQRSRLVHEALAAEFQGGLHALSLTLRTPAEQLARGSG